MSPQPPVPIGPPPGILPTTLPPQAAANDNANACYTALGLGTPALPTDEPWQHVYAILTAILNRLQARGF